MSNYALFSKDLGRWGESYQSHWGCHDICPLLEWFHITHMTQSELAALTCLKAWGDAKKFCSNVACLLSTLLLLLLQLPFTTRYTIQR